jgi:hypothetical protein
MTATKRGRTAHIRGRSRQTRLRADNGTLSSEFPKGVVKAEEAWGDLMSHQTEDCRILFNNVNTISYSTARADCCMIAERAIEKGAEIVGLAETNINWTHRDLMAESTHVFRKTWKHAKASYS